jgi:hypothetical protein
MASALRHAGCQPLLHGLFFDFYVCVNILTIRCHECSVDVLYAIGASRICDGCLVLALYKNRCFNFI